MILLLHWIPLIKNNYSEQVTASVLAIAVHQTRMENWLTSITDQKALQQKAVEKARANSAEELREINIRLKKNHTHATGLMDSG